MVWKRIIITAIVYYFIWCIFTYYGAWFKHIVTLEVAQKYALSEGEAVLPRVRPDRPGTNHLADLSEGETGRDRPKEVP